MRDTDAGRRYTLMHAIITAAMILPLAACAPATQTGLTVTYEREGEQRTLRLDPDQITCGEDRVYGLAISTKPQGRFSLGLDDDRRASVGGAGDDGLLLFEGTGIDISVSGNVLSVGASVGEVSLVEGWEPGDDVDVTPDDADQYQAELSGSIVCDEPIMLPTSAPASADRTAGKVQVWQSKP